MRKGSRSTIGRKRNRRFTRNETEIFEGEAVIFRTTQGGKVWQFRTWIQEHQKYYRKSLRTKDKDAALEKGRELYLQLNHRARQGEAIFSTTFRQLADVWLEHQKERVRKGDGVGFSDKGITKSRYSTLKTQTNRHIVPFVGEITKLEDIRGEQFEYAYTEYRRQKDPSVKGITISAERGTCSNIFRWAFRKRMIGEIGLPLWEEINRTSDNREALELEEWEEVWKYLRVWNKGITDVKELERRDFVKDFILILANSGARYGECRYLKWHSVKLVQQGANKVALLDIMTSKTKPRKNITCRRAEVFQRLRKLSKHKQPTDYVFVDNDDGRMIGRKTYYRLWDEIIEKTSLRDKIKKPTYYCLRHMFITFSLLKDIPIFDIAEQVGTSIHYISSTYAHVKRQERAHLFSQDLPKTEAIRLLME